MDVAIVTGAASGIGLAIARRLVALGMRVYGLGGNYGETPYSHEYFVPTPCNLADPADIAEKTEIILKKEGHIYLLVNNAKAYPSTPFLEKISLIELETVLRVNLLCPLILARLALPGLARLQGFMVNIVPSTADQAKGGPAGAAAAGGLRWLGQSLFEECRENGIKVTSIFPQANVAESKERDSSPVPEKNPQSVIDVEALADAVESIVKNPHGNIITEMVIRPQRLREKPVPPPLNIPFPPVKSIHKPYRPPTASDMEKTRAAIQKKAKKTKAREKSAPSRPTNKTPVKKFSKTAPKLPAKPRRKSRPMAKKAPNEKPEPKKAVIHKPKPKTKKTTEKPAETPKKTKRNRSRIPKRSHQ